MVIHSVSPVLWQIVQFTATCRRQAVKNLASKLCQHQLVDLQHG